MPKLTLDLDALQVSTFTTQDTRSATVVTVPNSLGCTSLWTQATSD